MSQTTLHRTVDLKSAVFILIGFIVGATIFVLPGSLAVDAGPAVFLAYIFAGIPAVFACFVMAQVGGAFPTSGAGYMIISKVLSPYWGFMYLCIMVSLVGFVVPLVAFGFADYLKHFLPWADVRVTSALIVAFFIFINCMGMSLSSIVQTILVLFFLLALIIFGFAGLAQGDTQLLQPMFPNGFSPVILAAITAYFSYAGVFVIAEIAGEVKDPGKTIPRAILISFAVIIFVYTLIPLSLVMTMPWASYGETDMAVVTASKMLLPSWIVSFIAFGALFAAATSINGLLMGLSRDFFMGAATKQFPEYFAKIDKRTDAPVRAVLAMGALSMAGVLVGGSITEFVQVAVLGLMLTQVVTAIAVLKLPKVLPQVYQDSHFKLGRRSRIFYSWGTIIFSTGFFIFLAMSSLTAVTVGAVYLLIASIYFKKRNNVVALGMDNSNDQDFS